MTTSSPQPLTTVFTPPASCLADINYYSYTASQSNALFNIGNNIGCPGFQCYAGYPSDSNCYPKGWALSQAFSPGVCPESYTIACSSFRASGTAIETIATCCPENFECLTATNPLWPWQATESCTSIFTQDFILTYTAAFNGRLGLSTVPVQSGQGVNANSVQVRWQSTDTAVLALLTPTGAAFPGVTVITITTGYPLPTVITVTTGIPFPTSVSYNSSKGVSLGAFIGIGVAGLVVLLAILVGVFMIWWKVRHRSSATPAAPQSVQPMQEHSTNPGSNPPTGPGVEPRASPGTQFQGTTAAYYK